MVPPAQGRKLFDAYRWEKKVVLLEGAGHNDIMQTQCDAYLRAIKEVLATRLGSVSSVFVDDAISDTRSKGRRQRGNTDDVIAFH